VLPAPACIPSGREQRDRSILILSISGRLADMERDPSGREAPARPVDEREYLTSQPPGRRIEGALDEIRRRVDESGTSREAQLGKSRTALQAD
jgi:hypothetical protein